MPQDNILIGEFVLDRPSKSRYAFHALLQSHMSTIDLGKVDAPNRLARSRDATTDKQVQSPLGELIDHPVHARFDIASKAARDWFGHLGRGGKSKAITVKVACANYVKHLASAGR